MLYEFLCHFSSFTRQSLGSIFRLLIPPQYPVSQESPECGGCHEFHLGESVPDHPSAKVGAGELYKHCGRHEQQKQ